MKYLFAIRDNTTGEIRYYDEGYDWDDEGHMLYMYTEGNYSCDCNRELFFDRAGGVPEQAFDDGDDSECGYERFTILTALRSDGETIKIDHKVPRK